MMLSRLRTIKQRLRMIAQVSATERATLQSEANELLCETITLLAESCNNEVVSEELGAIAEAYEDMDGRWGDEDMDS